MKYAYSDLSAEQFEQLVVLLCQHLLGIAVQGFAQGRDGGRDAKFIGTAELFPGRASLWQGTTIIQAKHTNGYNRSFSESDFSTIITREIPKIRKFRTENQLDHYLLFANRRLTAIAESNLRTRIATECGLPESSIHLCGLEQHQSAADEFQLKIIANRKDYQTFDNVMEYLADLLFGRDPVLKSNKRLTRTMLFYMYWHCDIGRVDDAC